ncbi:MAG: recombination mediator RecR [Pseudomonadota bacterium]
MDEAGPEIARLIQMLARLPGLGPRSARRAVLTMIRRREALLGPLMRALADVDAVVRECEVCGNIGTAPVCAICADPKRAVGTLCVVEDVADLWALERGRSFKGRYHVLGGVLSALDGVGPEALGIPALLARLEGGAFQEVILALNATVDGQTTAHYIADQLDGSGLEITSLAQGVPVGGELDYLDDGTIAAALRARRRF